MIPLKDNIPTSRFPLVNTTLIVISTVVFLLQGRGERGARIVEQYGLIPARVLNPDRPIAVRTVVPVRTPFGVLEEEQQRPCAEPPFSPWLTLITCIFLHGGWLHFLGNIWFLHIFGDNVEDRFGRFQYLAFYLVAGVSASVAHLLIHPESVVPTIGASGAIAGVMGAYLMLFPHAAIFTLLPLFIFFQVFVLPAWIFLGLWFLLQFFQGTVTLGSTITGGVAWWAHIGGFLVGILAGLWVRTQRLERYRGWD